MKAIFISPEHSIEEPFCSGPLDYILSRAEALHPGIEFTPSSPDSDEELDGVLFTASVPGQRGSIVIMDSSYRA